MFIVQKSVLHGALFSARITVPQMAQFHSTHFARLRSFRVVILQGTAIECTKFTEQTCTAFLVKPFVQWCLFVTKLYTSADPFLCSNSFVSVKDITWLCPFLGQ